jgi:hypothetical protein
MSFTDIPGPGFINVIDAVQVKQLLKIPVFTHDKFTPAKISSRFEQIEIPPILVTL